LVVLGISVFELLNYILPVPGSTCR